MTRSVLAWGNYGKARGLAGFGALQQVTLQPSACKVAHMAFLTPYRVIAA